MAPCATAALALCVALLLAWPTHGEFPKNPETHTPGGRSVPPSPSPWQWGLRRGKARGWVVGGDAAIGTCGAGVILGRQCPQAPSTQGPCLALAFSFPDL